MKGLPYMNQYISNVEKVKTYIEQNNRNILEVSSNKQEDSILPSQYDKSKSNFLRRIWDMNVTIKNLPDFEVAYVTHVGSYLESFKAWGQLSSWAGKYNLFPPVQHFIGISLDDPATTEEAACRYEACVTLPSDFDKANLSNGEVEYKTLPGGLHALYQFYDTIDRFAIAYQIVYGQWLPTSDYDPDDRYALEFSMNNSAEDPEGKAKVDLYIPIKKRE